MMQFHAVSEAGGHAENEDAYEVRVHPRDPGVLLCVVADGQGGQPRGGPAARLACQTCVESASGYPPEKLILPSVWTTLLRRVDQAVAKDPNAGFSTIVAFTVFESVVCGASSGDSAAVAICANLPGRILTENQYKNPPVGSGAAVFVPFQAILERPWTVLAMSDGVWKYVGWENILRGLAGKDGRAVSNDLLERARLRPSGKLQDDFTVVVLQAGDDS
jgi:hypothetical protein